MEVPAGAAVDLTVTLVPRAVEPGTLHVAITHLLVDPLEVGQTFPFQAQGSGGLKPFWLVRGPLGRVKADGLFTATQSGNGRVEAHLGPAQAAAPVSVMEALSPPPWGTVVGRVAEADGAGVAGATVRLGSLTRVTASDGTYTLADVPAGRHTLTAEKGERTASVTVEVRAGQTTTAPDLMLPPPPTGEAILNIQVVDEFSG